tara:strand:+ start:5778 stop:5894 length:117 start_codon:yes stop_codon:yes gene_type:complete
MMKKQLLAISCQLSVQNYPLKGKQLSADSSPLRAEKWL